MVAALDSQMLEEDAESRSPTICQACTEYLRRAEKRREYATTDQEQTP